MKTTHLLTLKALIIIGIFLGYTNTLLATNYYVSNNGNDSNNGTTLTSSLLTIQTALNITASGDTIYVRAGTYPEKLWWANSGSNNNPITLTNYNAETVIVSGINASNPTQGAAILISSKSYIRINGLTFKDNIMNYADGINVTGSGTDIHITNCEFDNIGWTNNKTTFPSPSDSAHAIIFVGSTSTSINNIFIGGNYIHDCITGYSESITIAGNVENFLIEGNTLDSNTNIGIDAAGHFTWTGAPADVNFSRSGIIRDNTVSNYAGPEALDAAGGIYTDGGSFITIENNTVYNYKVGYSVGCEVPGNTNTGNIVRNNLAYNCSLSGLFLGSNTTSVVNNTQVYNNTFYKCGFGTFDNGQMGLQNNSGSIIKNNIFYAIDGRTAMVQFSGTTSTNKVQSYNLYWRDNGDTSNLFFDITGNTNSILANPQFINVTSNDFHISTSSPAINAGDPSYNSDSNVFDIDGQARVLNNRVDIGVDENEIDEDTSSNDNLALNGTASQSTTGYNGKANRAIDGDTNGLWAGASVTHTSPISDSWWQVELTSQTNINNIIIYNRTNSCCIQRLSDFTVTVYDSNNNQVFSQTITEAPTPSITINTNDALGNRVRITNNLNNTALSLAEVEVYANSHTEAKTVIANPKITSTQTKAYPNPFINTIHIDNTTNNKIVVRLIDIIGNIVKEETINTNSSLNNLENLAKGIYLLQTTNINTQTTKTLKFIKN